MTAPAIAFEYRSADGARSVKCSWGGTCRIAPDSREFASALLSALLDFDAEPGARIIVLDSDPRALDETARDTLRARIGFIPADSGLISHLNGWENCVLPLGFHHPAKLPGIAPRVLQTLSALGCTAETLLAKLPEDMSMIERKSISFARALTLDPELLVMENFSIGLDPGARGRVGEFAAAYHAAFPGGTFMQFDHHDSV